MKYRIGEVHRRLVAALDNVQESYGLIKAGVFPDAEVCQDLLEQLAMARKAAEEWLVLISEDDIRH